MQYVMPTVIKRFITPQLLKKPLGEILWWQEYGELLFIAEDKPELTTSESKQRSIAMKEYEAWESISFDEIKNSL